VLDLPAEAAAERCLAAAAAAGYAHDRLLTWESVSASCVPEPARPGRGYTLSVSLCTDGERRFARVGGAIPPWLSAADKERMRADVADVAARLRAALSG
jgi:hypothetical protein